ncbi:MAG TPA: type II methionyl aminopeptidase [Planctomycetota bacterium]|jgi:methionyl aminopeptidase|nr:type II methionyl aminopeptidase [Planctomycetota bacterium]
MEHRKTPSPAILSPKSAPKLDLEALEKLRLSGRIACSARELAISKVLPGVTLRAVMDEVESFIRDSGGGPAFPAQTSRNAIAAHYCPAPNDATVYQEGDVVKVDIGVEVDGWVSDNAETKYLGEDPALHKLVRASQDALEDALSLAGPGVMVSELSKAIESAITRHGFRPVYNLTGHGVDRWKVHCAPQIPPTPDRHRDTQLLPGMVIAIEPFATDGEGTVGDKGRAEVFMVLRSPRKMKGVDRDVWEVIERMNGLPFARCTFPPALRGEKLESSLQRLLRVGSIMAFPPLVDPKPGVMISQAEHTALILEDGIEIITGTPLEG